MDIKEQIQKDLDNGFTKSDLERLIGLTKNSLSGFLKGNRNFSKKAVLKIERFMKSEKPDPLNLLKVSAKKFTIPANEIKEGKTLDFTLTATTKKEKGFEGIYPAMEIQGVEALGAQYPTVEEFKTQNNEDILKQIEQIKLEAKPSMVGKSQFEKFRQKRIDDLRKQLK